MAVGDWSFSILIHPPIVKGPIWVDEELLEEFAFHTRPYSNASVGRATG